MNELTKIPYGDPQRTGLVLPEGLDIQEWKRVGHSLCRCKDSLQFWIGDWINYGQDSYGREKYVEAMEIFGVEGEGDYGYNQRTLENFASICRRVESSLRREHLSFGHHEIVAGMEAEDQKYWLGLAEKEKLSVDKLRLRTRKTLKASAVDGQSVMAGMFDFSKWATATKRGFDQLFQRRPIDKWEDSEVLDGITKFEEAKKPFVDEGKRRGLEVG